MQGVVSSSVFAESAAQFDVVEVDFTRLLTVYLALDARLKVLRDNDRCNIA